MKRIIAALVMMLLGLIAIPLSASPAQATHCTNYSDYNSKTIRATDADGGNLGGEYKVEARVYWTDCGNETSVGQHWVSGTRYWFRITEVWGGCGIVRSWKVNPDILGGWNPEEQQRYCQNDDEVDEINWYPDPFQYGSDGVNVYDYMPIERKCIGGTITRDIQFVNDTTASLPLVCVAV